MNSLFGLIHHLIANLHKNTYFVLLFLALFSGCATIVRSCADYEGIPVHNGSDYEIRMWTAIESSEESVAQANLRRIIPAHSTSELITEIYYRQWERYFERQGQIVLIFTNSIPEHKDSLSTELSHFTILKQETLTKEKLDSLGWVINYP